MTSFFVLFDRLALEHGFEYVVVKNYQILDEVTTDIIVIDKGGFDYYVFFEIDFENLKYINNEIQILIATKFRDYLNSSDIDFSVSSFFENNTFLIISTKVKKNIETKDFYKNVAVVEEDPYYFKKQVFYYTDEEISSLKISNLNGSYIEHLNAVVSDIERYEKYTINEDDEYALVVRQFEKIPFLKLEVKEKELLSLRDIINKKIINSKDVDISLIPDLLALSDDELIDGWIESLGEEND
ncbi:hypothetical protein RFY44_19930 [Acinetobacter bereziniae]|uniref:ABC-three component system middle component 1 n=1 Tax=Acinetobacter bereziniae TaxID=106648 RepID=UPI0028137279|nr:ABC-three component system middle component 1 [Acinetobacter bereziniae]MDQ9821119.1 hypothetical protein [Acinetobacter bereziniae]